MKEIVLQPSFYDKFECIADKCKNNCCKGWKISFTKEEFKNIKRKIKSDEFRKIFQDAFDVVKGQDYYDLKLDKNKNCKFLDKNGLCKIYQEVGYKNMSITCKVFPRFCTHYINKYECFLSIACEEVVRLLLEEKDGLMLEVIERELNEEEKKSSIQVPISMLKEDPIFYYWVDIKMLFLGVLQNKAYNFGERMVVLGLAMQKIDELNIKGKQIEVPEYIQGFVTDFNSEKSKDIYKKLFENVNRNGNLRALQTLSYHFLKNNSDNLIDIKEKINNKIEVKRSVIFKTIKEDNEIKRKTELKIEFDKEKYEKAMQDFEEFIRDKEYWIENIMIEGFLVTRAPFQVKGGIWRNYCAMAVTYSIFLFTLTCCLEKDNTKEDFIYYVTKIARTVFHNQTHTENLEEHLKEMKSDSLAHMAMLVL